MKRNKRIYAAVLAVITAIMLFTLTAVSSAELLSEGPTGEPVPTEEPTVVPTEPPTPEPTEIPTPEPTEEPAPEPTQAPTEAPTAKPTEAPTEVPTEKPTEEPVIASYRIICEGNVYLYDTSVTVSPRIINLNASVNSLDIKQNEAVTLVSPISGKWQIQINGKWADIGGENSNTLSVSRTLFENLLSEAAHITSVNIRQIPDNGGAPLTVALSLSRAETDKAPFNVTSKKKKVPGSYAGDPGDKTLQDGLKTEIDFKYLKEDGEKAADTLTVIRTGDYQGSVKFPDIAGFIPTVNGSPSGGIDITPSTPANITVVYKAEPRLVYFLQNHNNDEYTRSEDKGDYNPGAGIAAPSGYKVVYANPDAPVIEADGPKIYVLCDREYTTLTLRLDDGGQDNEYFHFRNGRSAEIPAAAKDGYVFTGWRDAKGSAISSTRDLHGATELVAGFDKSGGGEDEPQKGEYGVLEISCSGTPVIDSVIARLTGAGVNNAYRIVLTPGKTVKVAVPVGSYHFTVSAADSFAVTKGGEQDFDITVKGAKINVGVKNTRTGAGQYVAQDTLVFNKA